MEARMIREKLARGFDDKIPATITLWCCPKCGFHHTQKYGASHNVWKHMSYLTSATTPPCGTEPIAVEYWRASR